MARYYTVILIVNIVFAAIFYRKVKFNGLSQKAFIFITGLSLFIAAIFPVLISVWNLYGAIGINLIIASLGSYYIVQTEKKIKEQVPETSGDPDPRSLPVLEESFPCCHNPEEAGHSSGEPEIPADSQEDTMPGHSEEGAVSNSDGKQGEEIMSIGRLSVQDSTDLLQSYILRGFDAKSEGKLDLTVKYFSSALELNPPPDLKVMLAFDICAALQEIGQYRKAKEFLEQFVTDGFSDLSDPVLREITINIKYLEILQEMLSKANSPNLPYSRIPALIRVSAEEKINQWKNEAL